VTDEQNRGDGEDSRRASDFEHALGEFAALVRRLRAEDLTVEDRVVLRRVLRELVGLTRLPDEPLDH
jgi:hypothetical protein